MAADKIHLVEQDICVDWDGSILSLEAAGFRRVLSFPCGAPETVSLCGPDHIERSAGGGGADFSIAGMIPAGPGEEWRLDGIRIRRRRADVFNPFHISVELRMTDPVRRIDYRREYRLFPGLPVISIANFVRSMVTPAVYQSPRMTKDNGDDPGWTESRADSVSLRFPTLRRSVRFYGRTDYSNRRIEESDCSGSSDCRGNILYADFPDGAGVGYFQAAPPSGERRDLELYDFRFDGGWIHSCCWGLVPEAFRPGIWLRGYVHTLFWYGDSRERMRIVKRLQMRLNPFDFAHHGAIMVNPWGCGRLPELASRRFTEAELEAAAEIGATHYQIDDGWQHGACLAELTRRNRCLTPEFWAVSPERFGGSFAAVSRRAGACGLGLGLWLAPSCNREYRDWRDTLRLIMDMYTRYHIRHFKIDGMKLRTLEAEENLRRLFTAARRRSGGEIVFNLDITNGQRPGYCMFGEFGNIFMENRYLCCDGVTAYDSGCLLRNLWLLAGHLPLGGIQIEIPCPEGEPGGAETSEARQKSFQELEYRAMLAFPGEPLLWFAPSTLAAESRRRMKAVMDIYREYRPRLAAAEVFPVGKEPDGETVSGFHFHDFQAGNGALLLFREPGCREGERCIEVPFLPTACRLCAVAGSGTVSISGDGVRANVSASPGYLLAVYS